MEVVPVRFSSEERVRLGFTADKAVQILRDDAIKTTPTARVAH